MRPFWTALIVMLLALGLTGTTVPARAAGSFSFTTIDAPGADQTSALGNNGAGQIVGFLINTCVLHQSSEFLS